MGRERLDGRAEVVMKRELKIPLGDRAIEQEADEGVESRIRNEIFSTEGELADLRDAIDWIRAEEDRLIGKKAMLERILGGDPL